MSAPLDLVLVNPGSRTAIYQSLGARLTAVENPVWAGLIATFARQKGLSVEIIDAEADELTPEQVAERAIALDPRLVAVVVYGHQPSASTQNMTGASAVVTALKRLSPTTKVLMIGGHVAALPGRTLKEEACDFVTRDEGLYGTTTLVEALRATPDPDLSKIPGLVYREAGQIRANPARRWSPTSIATCRHRVGSVAHAAIPRAQLALFRTPAAAAVRRHLHHARLSVPLFFCCIQAPFKGGESVSA
jgi:hypothetical protein